MIHLKLLGSSLIVASLLAGCGPSAGRRPGPVLPASDPGERPAPAADRLSASVRAVVDGALDQTRYTHSYDPSYVPLAYPGGDVPRETGVCTDVVVRAFRRAGVDLQREVHQDMRRAFGQYPRRYWLKRPDPNIDHRRVPNLMTFFRRKGRSLPITVRPEAFRPGDVVVWKLENGILHTGLVVDGPSRSAGWQVVHNIGQGAQVEDVLFQMEIVGHYRYFR